MEDVKLVVDEKVEFQYKDVFFNKIFGASGLRQTGCKEKTSAPTV